MSIDKNFGKNQKTINAVIYNGKYVDPSIIRKKILSVTAAIAGLICFVVLFIL
ncbi:hypothetical protein [Butyrivibrio sp. INlla14]|uniref:hypothetical protein n=1 Tax=Butyrivibrio sp. INlla14 TaxID=1520808 RepID=UPI00087712E3|nr:hypothetical protein [Butyrivibrio sp. INlla14]SCX97594.1 hypothetical protein SAMN02910371_00615 [Butyrivibrio sp. INlla14]